MRGNPLAAWYGNPTSRSIPAYAGEPLASPAFRHCSKVYPRVCGGTGCTAVTRPDVEGLSPRMRGNQVLNPLYGLLVRSIPAYAGEPRISAHSTPSLTVYPRVCGGTPVCGGPEVYPRVCGGTHDSAAQAAAR